MKSLRGQAYDDPFDRSFRSRRTQIPNYSRVTYDNQQVRPQSSYSFTPDQHQRHSSSYYGHNYNTAPQASLLGQSFNVQPFRQGQPVASAPILEGERYHQSGFKPQIDLARESQTKDLAVKLLLLLAIVYIPITALFSWSIGFLLFGLSAFNVFCKTPIKLVRPGYLTQIIFNVVLVTATVDRFLSYGLRYELMSKLVYSIPVAVYIVFQRWEDLFIAHIPIDQWNKLLVIRVFNSLRRTVRQCLDLRLLLICAALTLVCELMEVYYQQVNWSVLYRSFYQSLAVKLVMLVPIFHSINVTAVIQSYSRNFGLSKNVKGMRLFLWILKLKEQKFQGYHFKAVKHLNQIVAVERDLFDRELPIRSRGEDTYWDLLLNYCLYFLQQLLTASLPQQKHGAFEDVRVIYSKDNLLDDLAIYLKKVMSVVGLNIQSLRIRQQLQFTRAVCNILVKYKAYKQQYSGKFSLPREIVIKLNQVCQCFQEILQNKPSENQSSAKYLEYIKYAVGDLDDKLEVRGNKKRSSEYRRNY